MIQNHSPAVPAGNFRFQYLNDVVLDKQGGVTAIIH